MQGTHNVEERLSRIESKVAEIEQRTDTGGGSTRRNVLAGLLGAGVLGVGTQSAAAESSPWSDTDSDTLLEAPNHDGIDVGTIESETSNSVRIASSAGDIASKIDEQGTLFIEEGTYQLNNPIPITTGQLRVTGTPNTVLERQDDSKPMFTFDNNSLQIRVRFDTLRFWGTTSDTAPVFEGDLMDFLKIADVEFREFGGLILKGDNYDRSSFERCNFDRCSGDIVDVSRPADFHLVGCEFDFRNVTHTGTAITLTGTLTVQDGGATIDRCIFMDADRALYFDGLFNIELDRAVIDNSARAPVLNGCQMSKISNSTFVPADKAVNGIKISGRFNHKLINCRVYQANRGYYFEGTDEVLVSNSIARDSSNGMRLEGVKRFDISNTNVYECDGSGLTVTDANDGTISKHGTIVAGQFYNNANGGTSHGINLAGSTDRVFILGNHAFDNQSTKSQNYGIRAGSNTNNIWLAFNDVLGNKDGEVKWNSPGGRSFRRLNVFNQTLNHGQTSVADGDTIPHGLVGTPDVAFLETMSSNRAYADSVDNSGITVGLEDSDGNTVSTTETVMWYAIHPSAR